MITQLGFTFSSPYSSEFGSFGGNWGGSSAQGQKKEPWIPDTEPQAREHSRLESLQSTFWEALWYKAERRGYDQAHMQTGSLRLVPVVTMHSRSTKIGDELWGSRLWNQFFIHTSIQYRIYFVPTGCGSSLGPVKGIELSLSWIPLSVGVSGLRVWHKKWSLGSS